MPLLPTSLFKKGIRVAIEQPEVPRQGHKLKSFGIGLEGSGWQGTVKPTRLEVRRNMRATDRNYDPELLPRAEAGSSSQSISDLRKHLARKVGTKYKPTGSVSNSPYDLRGGDLGVPSYGVSGAPSQSKKALLRARKSRRKGRM